MDPRYNPQLKNLRTISPDIIRPPPGLRETADNTFGPHITHRHVPPSQKPPSLPKPKKRIISVEPTPLPKPRKRIISVEPAPLPKPRKRIISVQPSLSQNTSVQSSTKKKRIISVKPAPPKSQKNKSNGGRRRKRKSLINKKLKLNKSK